MRLVIALLLMDAIVPALGANAFVAERGAALRAIAVFPLLLAGGLWAGWRIVQVLARGCAAIQMFAACCMLLFALLNPNAPFTVIDLHHPIPRLAGLTVTGLLVLSGWWQWRLLGRQEVRAWFASARW